MEVEERGVVFVGPRFMKWVIRSGTEAGVTCSIIWKEGRRRTDVDAGSLEWESGIGMLEAESMRRYIQSIVRIGDFLGLGSRV